MYHRLCALANHKPTVPAYIELFYPNTGLKAHFTTSHIHPFIYNFIQCFVLTVTNTTSPMHESAAIRAG